MLGAMTWILALFALAAGDKIADFSLPDTKGTVHTLSARRDAKAVVLFFTGTQCPLAGRALPRLIQLEKTFGPRGVVFFAVHSNAFETKEEIARHAAEAGTPFPTLIDADQRVADQANIAMTPTVLVLDPSREIRYRGALDDHKQSELVKKPYVRLALEALLDGRPVETPETPVAGCHLQRKLNETAGAVTYAEHVAPILHRRCASCHRPDQIAPFPLLTYADARKWARDIKRTTQLGTMPPWKPVNEGFQHERRLSPEERTALRTWVDAGAPPGDLAKAPAPPRFPEGWILGEPDLVLEAPAYEVAAEGDDEWRCYVLPATFDEHRWVSAVEIRPGNPRVVHHIVVWMDRSGQARKLDEADPGPGYKTEGTGPVFIPASEMGGWAPGNLPYVLPDGVARELRRGTTLVLEVHYHKSGRRERDQTKLGLHFAKKPVVKPLRGLHLLNHMFRIPAGAERHRVTASARIGHDSHALAIMPHMHYLGREFKVEAIYPDASRRTLVEIRAWDFNWQDTYLFKQPVALPKGTKLLLEAYFDNSEKNPNNPNSPPKPVGWGDRTTDEMLVSFLWVTRDREDLTQGAQDEDDDR